MSTIWRIYMIVCIIMYVHEVCGKLTEREKAEFCQTLRCKESEVNKVCGIRKENGVKTYRLFDNECLLLKYGCHVRNGEEAYGITHMKSCIDHDTQQEKNDANCISNCDSSLKEPVCGIRQNGDGFTIKIFINACQLAKYNCEQRLEFKITDFFICNEANNHNHLIKRRNEDQRKGHAHSDEEINESPNYFEEENKKLNKSWYTDVANNNETSVEKENREKMGIRETTNTQSYIRDITNTTDTDDIKITKEIEFDGTATSTPPVKNKTFHKNVVIMRGSMKDMQKINITANNFFAATHVFDLPVRDIYPNLTDATRRRLIHIFGPMKVFVPSMTIPDVIIDDHYHQPTLSTCFHKCPQKCPKTYSPVCGMPGTEAREPSLVFLNHCYMDVAQCKMYWENKSDTARSSAYVESSFIFCLGDELTGLYRFLPMIRSLQHMGRLKKKSKFKYRSKNMRFLNELLSYDPKLMG